MKRAIIYARVSTDDQADNNSLPSQVAACERYAAQNGFSIVAIFQEAMSGAKLERPHLTKVRQLINRGEIDALIIYSSDRLTRSVAHSLLIRDELRRSNVSLHCVTKGQAALDTPEGGLFETIEAAFAEYERLKIRERMMRGMQGKIESGRVSGRGNVPPYGFCWKGQGRDRELEVIESEAAIIKQIFAWYAEGVTVYQILKRLTERRVPTPADNELRTTKARQRASGEWARSTVYDLLRNELYAGRWYYARRKKQRPSDIWVPVERLIDEQIWEACQRRINEGKQMSFRNTRRFYLLGRRIRCSCGYCVSGAATKKATADYRYYRCASQLQPMVRRCNLPSFDALRLELVVWDWIAGKILNEEHIRSAIEDRRRSTDSLRASFDEQRLRIHQQQVDLQMEIQRFYDRFAKGKLTDEQLDELEMPRRAAITALEKELDRLNQESKGIEVSPDDEAELLRLVRDVRTYLLDGRSGPKPETKRRIIDLIDAHCVLMVIDGERYVDVTVTLTTDGTRLSLTSGKPLGQDGNSGGDDDAPIVSTAPRS